MANSPILFGADDTANNLQKHLSQTGRFIGSGAAIPWTTGITYSAGDIVIYGGNQYVCITANTAGATFEADYALNYWKQTNQPIVGKNYMAPYSFEANTTNGWQYFVASSYSVTGGPSVGGVLVQASLNMGIESTSPLSGKYSLKISNVAATNLSVGHGILSPILTLDSVDQAKVLINRFAYQAAGSPPAGKEMNFSGTSANTWSVYIAEINPSTNGIVQWIQPAGVFNFVQSSGVGISTGTWQTPSTMTKFRIGIFCNVSTTATTPAADTYQLIVDDFYVGPQPFSMGPAMSDWKDYTPTGSWVSGTATYLGRWRRVGSDMELVVSVTANSGVTAANLTIAIPSFATIDYAKTYTGQKIGLVYAEDYAVAGYDGEAYVATPTTIGASILNAGTAYAQSAAVSATAPFTFALNDYVTITAKIPIVGWSSNTVQSADTDTRVIAAQYKNVSTATLNSTFSLVSWGDKDFDTAGAMVSGSTFTAPVSGVYEFGAQLYVTASAANNGYWSFRKNGTAIGNELVGGIIRFNASGNSSIVAPVQAQLNAGDIVYLMMACDTSGVITLGSSSRYIIKRLSGPAVVQATETVACSYTNSVTPQSGINPNNGFAVLAFPDKIKDSHSVWSSNNLFTAPCSGSYSITATANLSNTNILATRYFASIFKGTTETIRGAEIYATASQFTGLTVSGIVQLNSGDTIQIKLFSGGNHISNTLTSDFGSINIFRVGN